MMRVYGFLRVIISELEVREGPAFDVSLVFIKGLIDLIPALAE
jgi:hypothetical protein